MISQVPGQGAKYLIALTNGGRTPFSCDSKLSHQAAAKNPGTHIF
jgi:hypothetical protein